MRQPSALIRLFAVLAVAVVSFGASSAAAQQPPAPAPEGTPPAAAPAPPAAAEAPIGVAPVTPQLALPSVATSNGPSAVAASNAPPAVDDHASVVGHWAVGYQGISSLPIGAGCCDSGGGPQLGTVNAPVIGVRYWFRHVVGVDVGLGLGVQTGSDQPSAYGFALHAGLPIVLGHGRHTAFEVIPEATVGFTTGRIPASGGIAATSGSVGGLLLRAGARAGAEVHFGFIGLPELALQATVGLYARFEAYHFNQDVGNISLRGNSTLITTSVNDNPWGIFTDTIAALYYF